MSRSFQSLAMQQDRRLWDVLGRMDTLQYEECRAADERLARESLERGDHRRDAEQSGGGAGAALESPGARPTDSGRHPTGPTDAGSGATPPHPLDEGGGEEEKKSAAGSRWIVDPAPAAGCRKRF